MSLNFDAHSIKIKVSYMPGLAYAAGEIIVIQVAALAAPSPHLGFFHDTLACLGIHYLR